MNTPRARRRRRRFLNESAIIERFFSQPSTHRRDVPIGIGDDAAITRLAPGYDLVIATDVLLEGTHFTANTPARSIGHRSLAVNLSDLAAMGAEPLWATLALSLRKPDGAWLSEFSHGFFRLARQFKLALVGGDTVRGRRGATVTVHGRVRPGRYVTRRGARPGDAVYVTGHPGDGVGGRLLLDRPHRAGRGGASLIRRFLYPAPRVREGRALVGIATAMIDISDGLHEDAGKLVTASGGGAELHADAVPLSAGLLRFAGAGALRLALTGGDDYELLFTVPPAKEARLHRLASGWRCPLTRLGQVTRGRSVQWQFHGRPFAVPARTFRHF
jgi:thiamine-monophosphate kinase